MEQVDLDILERYEGMLDVSDKSSLENGILLFGSKMPELCSLFTYIHYGCFFLDNDIVGLYETYLYLDISLGYLGKEAYIIKRENNLFIDNLEKLILGGHERALKNDLLAFYDYDMGAIRDILAETPYKDVNDNVLEVILLLNLHLHTSHAYDIQFKTVKYLLTHEIERLFSCKGVDEVFYILRAGSEELLSSIYRVNEIISKRKSKVGICGSADYILAMTNAWNTGEGLRGHIMASRLPPALTSKCATDRIFFQTNACNSLYSTDTFSGVLCMMREDMARRDTYRKQVLLSILFDITCLKGGHSYTEGRNVGILDPDNAEDMRTHDNFPIASIIKNGSSRWLSSPCLISLANKEKDPSMPDLEPYGLYYEQGGIYATDDSGLSCVSPTK